MKLTLQTQILPDATDAARLKATVERFNEAADWLAGFAFERRVSNKRVLQKLAYRELRERFDISSQMAVRCIAQVCEAYKRDKSIRPRFRKHAAVPYDKRLMSFKGPDRVSLLTLEGRVLVPVVMGKYQAERFTPAHGQCDLVLREDGRWFLLVTVDLPEGTKTPATDFIGVDLGIINIATDSDGETHSGDDVERTRQHYADQRRGLDRAAGAVRRRGKRPKSIRKARRRAARRESRFRKDRNHVISKQLVAKAKDTGRGIGLEDLKGIRDRTTVRKPQRARHSGWSFFQLRTFVEYKAKLSGVPVVLVDPRDTSRTCPECGHCEGANRKSQSEFECRVCGHRSPADLVGARNIASRARVQVMAPQVAESRPKGRVVRRQVFGQAAPL
ncbi:MAG: transposase [Planctomycetaceae bacterium]|nr:transposase [Planctomycetaceae bacterium]